jgi:hypothetical protein
MNIDKNTTDFTPMNKKITKENRDLVETIKAQILDLSDQQEELFDKLIEDLAIEDETDINWVFDFIYNAGTISNEYYKMVESSIFEQDENLV